MPSGGVPSPVDRYAGGTYLQDHPSWHVEDSAWKAGHIARMLGRNGLEPESVVEIGCGAGAILRELRSRLAPGCRFSGFDVSPQAIALCGEGEGDTLEFHVGDFPPQGRHFDVLLAIDVVEHVEDYLGFLRRCHECATYAVFHIPLDLSVQTVLRAGPILGNRDIAGHLHYFTKELALRILEDTGYEVLDSFYTAGGLDLPPRSRKQRLARAPRALLFRLNQDAAARVLGGFSLMVLARSST